jgi:hypothetical protein
MKFIAIEETTKQDSGSDAERFYQKCKAIFEKRYPQFGNPDAFSMCKDYLGNKPKFASFCKTMENKDEAKKEKSKKCPTGKKKEQENEQDKKLIKKALTEAGIVDLSGDADKTATSSGGDSLQTVMSVIAALGNSVVSFWEKESEGKFIEALPTPEKKELKSEMAKMKLLEMRQKRRKMEMTAEEDELKLASLKLQVIAQTAQQPPPESKISHSSSERGGKARVELFADSTLNEGATSSLSSKSLSAKTTANDCCAGVYCSVSNGHLKFVASPVSNVWVTAISTVLKKTKTA